MKAVIFDFYGTLAQIAPATSSFHSMISRARRPLQQSACGADRV